jgi:hypothetical protein
MPLSNLPNIVYHSIPPGPYVAVTSPIYVAPGAYPGDGFATLLRPNMQQYLVQNQDVTSGMKSIAVQLERRRGTFAHLSFGAEVTGMDVSEVELEVALTDRDEAYVSVGADPYPGSNGGMLVVYWDDPTVFVRAGFTASGSGVSVLISQ